MEMIAAQVMSREVLAVDADMTVQELASFLTEKQITGAPVLDRRGRLVGVVSETDLAEAELERAQSIDDGGAAAFDVRSFDDDAETGEMRGMHLEPADLTVRDIMTPTAYTVPHDTTVKELARTMVTGRIHRLLVTRDSHVVGIVTSLDLLKLLYGSEAANHGYARPSPRKLTRN
jgi:CBS domain-containing protein